MSESVVDPVTELLTYSLDEYDTQSFRRVTSRVPPSEANVHVMPKHRLARSMWRVYQTGSLQTHSVGANIVIDEQWMPIGLFFGGSEPSTETEGPLKELKSLLKLSDNWDNEGSEAFRPETVERASHLLRTLATEFRRLYRRVMPNPTTGPGAEGSIDLIWRRGNGDLMITVPVDAAEGAAFSGSRGEYDRIQGVLPIGAPLARVLGWLADSPA